MIVRTLIALSISVSLSVAAVAEEGGLKDSTGLVWSQSQKLETNSWWDWSYSTANAAKYWVVDVDATGTPTLYDDWRLPTVHEVQTAILDGTLAELMPIVSWTDSAGVTQYNPVYISTWIWTAETRGTKAWQVQVVRASSYPWPLLVGSSGSATLRLKTGAFEAFFVRGKAPAK